MTSSSSVFTPPMGAQAHLRLDSIFARNVGARYRATPPSPAAVLTAADRTRATGVLQSTWDADVVKRVAKDTLGNKASSFSGSEPHRRVLWDSLVSSLEAAFASKEAAATDIFDLVDLDKAINPIYNDILLRSLVSLTTPHSPARRWVEASARAAPKDGKRALLEVTKRLLPPNHKPLRHHEELLGIFFASAEDPEPLVARFDECLKAISVSGAGALEDRYAKRQLLSALDPNFYKEVITPLRLDSELDKVCIEEVYAHICEVWWCANPDGPTTRIKALPPPISAASYAPTSETDFSDFMHEFQRVLGEANDLLRWLKSAERDSAAPPGPVEPPPPPPRQKAGGVRFPPTKWRDGQNRSGGKFHGRNNFRSPHVGHRFAAKPLAAGGSWSQRRYPKPSAHRISFHSLSSAFIQECPLCPGHFHDSARCPEVGGACGSDAAATALELDDVVSAFQTAFDYEDDSAFAELCSLHDAPVVRSGEEPFTYPAPHDLGLRAQYAGLVTPNTPHPEFGTSLSEARTVLSGLRDATAAARAAAAVPPDGVSFGTISVPQVVPPPPPANPPAAALHSAAATSIAAPLQGSALAPVAACDPANFASPFADTFADRFALRVEQDPALHFDSFSLPPPLAIWGPPLSVVGSDTDSECEPEHLPAPDPPAAPAANRIGVSPAPRFARLAAGLLSVLTVLGCATTAHGPVVQQSVPAVFPAVPSSWVTANCCTIPPGPSLPALPPDPSAHFLVPCLVPDPSPLATLLDISGLLDSGFLALVLDSGPGFLALVLDSGPGLLVLAANYSVGRVAWEVEVACWLARATRATQQGR
ncbi:hypothetical protein CYMTET_47196 [Cymbomonas tetramitiformis]|uniref:Uncharacterized protein n=1 Tax=Cymbomonas tetramitiformis TaxID=36881 RepID=A0AAE0BW87_9CHLO|nr:hypothetical protein CYMTET_47196 [Cymbomonas tetramitiformis]